MGRGDGGEIRGAADPSGRFDRFLIGCRGRAATAGLGLGREHLHGDGGAHAIRVNLVTPGFVRTPLWRNIPEADREAMYAAAGARLPVGRVGEAAEVAETYLFLMRQGFATGQSVVVDGGGVLV